MESKKSLEQIHQDNKKLFQNKINKERRDFHLKDRVNQEKYMNKSIKLYKWQIKTCQEQIEVLKGHLEEINARHDKLKKCVEEGDVDGFEMVVFG